MKIMIVNLTIHGTPITCNATVSPMLSMLSVFDDVIPLDEYSVADLMSYVAFCNTGTILYNTPFNKDMYSYMGHKVYENNEYTQIRLMEEWNRVLGHTSNINGLHITTTNGTYKLGKDLNSVLIGIDHCIAVRDKIHTVILLDIKSYNTVHKRLIDLRNSYTGYRSVMSKLDGINYEFIGSDSISSYAHNSTPCIIYYKNLSLVSLISLYCSTKKNNYLNGIFNEYISMKYIDDHTLEIVKKDNVMMYPFFNLYPRCHDVNIVIKDNVSYTITKRKLTQFDLLYCSVVSNTNKLIYKIP